MAEDLWAYGDVLKPRVGVEDWRVMVLSFQEDVRLYRCVSLNVPPGIGGSYTDTFPITYMMAHDYFVQVDAR